MTGQRINICSTLILISDDQHLLFSMEILRNIPNFLEIINAVRRFKG